MTRRIPFRTLVLLLPMWIATVGQAQVPLPESGGPASEAAQIFEFTTGGAAVSMTVDSADAGSEPTEATDTSTELHWGNGYGVPTKITVSTVCPGQSFGLSVAAQVTSWGSGTQASPQPAVTLSDGMMEADLLRDLVSEAPGNEGYATLVYRATATVSDGTSAEHGDDYHTITYTITAQ